MFKIISASNGESLGMTEAPNYIKQAENGCFVLCPEPEASGIAFEGTTYHLLGRDALEGLETVALQETDAGAELDATKAAQEDADAMNVDQEYRLTLLELGLTADETA
ncbi:MAG: hypothetical protein ACI3W5_12760 [Faecousia sp.]